jgi:eukaryotic-like serine/threonine-protein kinase
MSIPATQRVAALAVRCFGADRSQVERLAEAVHGDGGACAELLAALVDQGLLTPIQAEELRHFLDRLPAELDDLPTAANMHTPMPQNTENDLDLSAGFPQADEPSLLGGFRILRRLGEGSMGTVYLGYHEEKDRQVAIKVLAHWLATNPSCVERFYRESKNSALLAHPNIVRGYSAGYDGQTGRHYLVREFVDGLSAQVLLDRLGWLPVGAAVQIVLDVARALEYLQARNLVHRDIKPDNVLLTRSGVTKLADLGLLKRSDEVGPRTAILSGFGTSYYMPYEQAAGNRRLDTRSDIYALGATFYHLLTGEVPFSGNSHQEIVEKKAEGSFIPASAINRQVPPQLDQILRQMLAQRPEDRYASASDLVADLERLVLAADVATFPNVIAALNDDARASDSEHFDQRTRPDYDVLRSTEENIAGSTQPGNLASYIMWLCQRIWPLILVGLGVASAGVLFGAILGSLQVGWELLQK